MDAPAPIIHPVGGFGLLLGLSGYSWLSWITCTFPSVCLASWLLPRVTAARVERINYLHVLHSEQVRKSHLCRLVRCIHAYRCTVCVYFYPPVFKVPFLPPFTSSNCYFRCSIPAQTLSAPSTRSLKDSTMWLLMTSSVPVVYVSMAEDTSQWASPDHWTVKSVGNPVGTVLEGHEQDHRDKPSTRSDGCTWYFDSLSWSVAPFCYRHRLDRWFTHPGKNLKQT